MSSPRVGLFCLGFLWRWRVHRFLPIFRPNDPSIHPSLNLLVGSKTSNDPAAVAVAIPAIPAMGKGDKCSQRSSRTARTGRSKSRTRRRRLGKSTERGTDQKKTVAFLETVRVHETLSIDDLTSKERKHAWYSSNEMSKIRRRDAKLQESLNEMSAQDRAILMNVYGMHDSFRVSRPQERTARIHNYRVLVLCEQERQWDLQIQRALENNDLRRRDYYKASIADPKVLAKLSLEVSQGPRLEAEQRGSEIAQQVTIDLRRDLASSSSKRCTTRHEYSQSDSDPLTAWLLYSLRARQGVEQGNTDEDDCVSKRRSTRSRSRRRLNCNANSSTPQAGGTSLVRSLRNEHCSSRSTTSQHRRPHSVTRYGSGDGDAGDGDACTGGTCSKRSERKADAIVQKLLGNNDGNDDCTSATEVDEDESSSSSSSLSPSGGTPPKTKKKQRQKKTKSIIQRHPTPVCFVTEDSIRNRRSCNMLGKQCDEKEDTKDETQERRRSTSGGRAAQALARLLPGRS